MIVRTRKCVANKKKEGFAAEGIYIQVFSNIVYENGLFSAKALASDTVQEKMWHA